ncbi:MAG TPA: OmpA family protein [Ignavibacteriales bacterium]|nr:OmpA family protein [Ignavibacteriales bacterium]
MHKSIKAFLALFIIASFLASGCGSSNTVKGGGIGAAAGGVIGGVIGSKTGSTAVGAIIGAAVGGAAGALIGNYMDRQAEEMRKDLEGARVERVGEGIKITFPSGILFATNKFDLQPAAKDDIQRLAKILKKYSDTNVLIEGHTDSDGTEAYNQTLSEKRAASVASYAENLGVKSSRVTTKGYGETQPVASNATPEGKQANRRVEIAVYANDKLKKAAEKGELPPVKG